jgi:hypothetical protein
MDAGATSMEMKTRSPESNKISHQDAEPSLPCLTMELTISPQKRGVTAAAEIVCWADATPKCRVLQKD